ncbi:MAG: hypothetical protein ABI681_07770 [Gemmatimonadales bacterium]
MRSAAMLAMVAGTIAAAACRAATSSSISAEPEPELDYTVYSATLDGLFGQPMPSDSGRRARFVVRDSTLAGGLATAGLKTEYIRRQFGNRAKAFEGTTESFLARNQSRVALSATLFTARGSVETASSRELPPPNDPDGYWRAYYERFPRARGLIGLSRPGYDKARRHALVYYSMGCGGLCGEGGYVLLERREGKWLVLKRVVTMMS